MFNMFSRLRNRISWYRRRENNFIADKFMLVDEDTMFLHRGWVIGDIQFGHDECYSKDNDGISNGCVLYVRAKKGRFDVTRWVYAMDVFDNDEYNDFGKCVDVKEAAYWINKMISDLRDKDRHDKYKMKIISIADEYNQKEISDAESYYLGFGLKNRIN